LIYQTQSALRGLVNYTGSGTIKSLADLGIELDASGKMSLNQTTTAVTSLSSFSFLGSATTGFGRLSSQLNQISDPIAGLIKVKQDQYDAADTRIPARSAPP
jgi:hypothetical protein